MTKKVFEGVCEFDDDDGGCALIATIDELRSGPSLERGMFVRVQSWDETDNADRHAEAMN